MNKAVKYTYITIGINLLLAILILILISGESNTNPIKNTIDFITYFFLNIVCGISALFLSGYYIATKMKTLICQKKWNAPLVGIMGLMIILISGILGGATVTFLEEGLTSMRSIADELFDYYVKPLFWILIFGCIPTCIAGSILGIQIKKSNKENNQVLER